MGVYVCRDKELNKGGGQRLEACTYLYVCMWTAVFLYGQTYVEHMCSATHPLPENALCAVALTYDGLLELQGNA